MSEGEIRQQAQLFALMVEAYAVNALIEGMKSENAQRKSTGHSPAYTESSFVAEARILTLISDRMRTEI